MFFHLQTAKGNTESALKGIVLLGDVFDILDPVPYHLGNSGLLLSHAQKTIRAHDGALVVRDDDELALLVELIQNAHECSYVVGIQSGIDLIETTERRRLDHLGCKQKCHSGHGALSSGEKPQLKHLLSGRLSLDIYT